MLLLACFTNNLHYSPTPSAFLQVESIDRSWHPFSIASDPDSSVVEFYIEVFGEGSWTNCLWTKLQSKGKGIHQKMCINLLGPYGTALVKDSAYTNIIAIGTGTGKSYRHCKSSHFYHTHTHYYQELFPVRVFSSNTYVKWS